ncbi:PEP-CTERM sorting domain-containing protein [Aquabacterium parvum]|jgi:hypothetical protein|uniref:PEP-CTERM sorting domain-containing protein n=1 Tax=Aquabacterium parvum TaxID=70584 RepID=UPI000718D14F|nr:PEP-CTERM sorting domain-containing protein [Aquabacterium parvum]MBU0915417.1 PEP-CTERM sorting domain-containing protein [Gammaproteobacteria bacterium]
MAIKPCAAVAAATLTLLAFAAPAQAELQTWSLTATAYELTDGFTAPAFAELGKTFRIDYVIDIQTPSLEGWSGLFDGAVKSFTINGLTSLSEGYVVSVDEGGLNGINTWPIDARSDGIDFVSFFNLDATSYTDVASTLKDLATFAPTSSTVLRVDFGENSVWAAPTLFVMTSAVPEPSAAWLLLMGLPLLVLKRNRRNAAA